MSTPATAAPAAPVAHRLPSLVADRLDRAGAVTLAGGLAGLVVLGGGARLAMRLVALTSGQIGTGVRPESGAVPGTVTLEGTVFLLLAGSVLGVAFAVITWCGLARWLPAGGWARGAAVTSLAAVLPAVALLDPHNIDFALFGPRWFAVALFLAVPVGYGAAVAWLGPRLWARHGGRAATVGRRLLGAVGLVVTVAMTLGVGTESPVLVLLPLVVVAGVVLGPAPADRAARPRARWTPAVVSLAALTAAGVIAWRAVVVALV